VAPFAASAAIFMQDPLEGPMMPGEAFARLHKLTGGELRVLLALAQGLDAKEAADMLGIGEPTVRTHLQHMFAKTHTLHPGRPVAPVADLDAGGSRAAAAQSVGIGAWASHPGFARQVVQTAIRRRHWLR